jgi:glutamine synthetase
MDNLQFLTFLTAVIKAVDDYQDLLRVTVASPGNDHRLGANEAPPAIISIFVGDELGAILDAIASDSDYHAKGKGKIDLGVDVLPVFPKDNTDRNRTSPFAFTGNKFEFRMPGSAMNLSDANTVLNTAVAKVLKDFAEEMEGKENFTEAAAAWIKTTIKAHQRILFNGNGYSAEWEAEAEKRGLANMKTTVDALPCMISDKNIALMSEMNVLSPVEVQSRYEVELEHYSKVINIEALTTLGMARRQLIPAALDFMSSVANTAAAKQAVSDKISVKTEEQILTYVSRDTDDMCTACDKLEELMNKVDTVEGTYELAEYYCKTILPAMDEVRAAADHCEIIVGKDYWPLPSYSDMLFYV